MNRREFTKSLLLSAAVPGLRIGDSATFDVRDYGARGNGRTDDSDAFRRAVAAARVNGGMVSVPAGTYLVPRRIHLFTGVGIAGMGATSIIRHLSGDPEVIVANGAQNVTIHDLAIEGSFAHGVLFHNAADSSVVRCDIRGGTVPRYGLSGGVLIVGSRRVTVEACHFQGNGGDGYIQGSDIQCDGLGASSSEIRILGNRCSSTRVAISIRCYNTSRSEIRGNVVSGARMLGRPNHGYGILIYPTMSNLNSCFENAIIGNTVSHTDGSGIYLVLSPHSRVEDNVIDDVARKQADIELPVAGIALNQSEHMTILRNVITRSGKAGITIASSRAGVGHVEVRDNIISDTSGYGVHLRGTLDDIKVTGNTIVRAAFGIGGHTKDEQNDIEIARNRVSAIRGSAIILGNARGSRVEENVIRDVSGYGLELDFEDDSSTAPNNDVQNAGTTWGAGTGIVRVRRRGRPVP